MSRKRARKKPCGCGVAGLGYVPNEDALVRLALGGVAAALLLGYVLNRPRSAVWKR